MTTSTATITILNGHWTTEARVIGETEKAVHLERVGDRRFDDRAGSRAWFPRKALVASKSGVEGVYQLARWFKGDTRHERFLGEA